MRPPGSGVIPDCGGRFVQERLLSALADLSEEEMLQRPMGLAPVLWHVGHAALYNARLVRQAGEPITIPEEYERIFARGSSGDGSLPPPARVLDFFREANQALLRLAAGDLDRPAASPSRTYQTVGGGLLRMLYHAGYHLGKIMTLRALLGKSRLLG